MSTQLKQVMEARCDIVGISVPQGAGALASAVCRVLSTQARAGGAHPLVVFGNSLPSALPDQFFAIEPHAVIVPGWGERPLCDLADQMSRGMLDLSTVPGIVYRAEGTIVANSADQGGHPLVSAPHRYGAPGEFFRRVEASRGCHFGACTFCARPHGPRSAWYPVRVDQVVDEVEKLVIHGDREFTFADEDFVGNDRSRAYFMMQMLRRLAPLRFTASFRADSLLDPKSGSIDSELLRALSLAGLRLAFIGVESLSQSQLVRYGKRQSPQLSIAVVRALEAHGIEVEIGNIPFDPLLSMAELSESTKLLLSSGLYRNVGAPLAALRLHPGTPFAASHRVPRRPKADDPDMLELGWAFTDDDVAALFSVLHGWWTPLDPAYLLARNLLRTGICDPGDRDYVLSRIASLRGLAVRLLCVGTRGHFDDPRRGAVSLSGATSAALVQLSEIGSVAIRSAGRSTRAVADYLDVLEELKRRSAVDSLTQRSVALRVDGLPVG